MNMAIQHCVTTR